MNRVNPSSGSEKKENEKERGTFNPDNFDSVTVYFRKGDRDIIEELARRENTSASSFIRKIFQSSEEWQNRYKVKNKAVERSLDKTGSSSSKSASRSSGQDKNIRIYQDLFAMLAAYIEYDRHDFHDQIMTLILERSDRRALAGIYEKIRIENNADLRQAYIDKYVKKKEEYENRYSEEDRSGKKSFVISESLYKKMVAFMNGDESEKEEIIKGINAKFDKINISEMFKEARIETDPVKKEQLLKTAHENLEIIRKKNEEPEFGYKSDPAFLLSEAEFELSKEFINFSNRPFWLRDEAKGPEKVMYVNSGGRVDNQGEYPDVSMNIKVGLDLRKLPVSTSFIPGDSFALFGHKFICIRKTLAVMDDDFMKGVFGPANDYEGSDARALVNEWFDRQIRIMQSPRLAEEFHQPFEREHPELPAVSLQPDTPFCGVSVTEEIDGQIEANDKAHESKCLFQSITHSNEFEYET